MRDNETRKLMAACAICSIDFKSFMKLIDGISNGAYHEVRNNLIKRARNSFLGEPGDPLECRVVLRPRRAFGYHKALIYRSRISGRVARIKAL